jgi:hypothetical protein|tara:strand:+ start:1147 stop:1257 length:111 start_codon:yes stop_codon:yes gene_type:complete
MEFRIKGEKGDGGVEKGDGGVYFSKERGVVELFMKK